MMLFQKTEISRLAITSMVFGSPLSPWSLNSLRTDGDTFKYPISQAFSITI